MYQDKYVFAQLTSFLNRSKFNRIVSKYDGNKYVKHFTCWNQLLSMMFGQFSNRESLRDLIVALDAHHSKSYHLGLGKNVSKSSLARANQDREWKRRLPKNVLSDLTIELTGFYPKQYYPAHLRLIKFWDEEQEREFIFLTNAKHITSLKVADLYKNRWQVELFFKWLKQHLKIKKFWGTTENAVRVQIYAAICTYCLVAIIQKDMQIDRSTYEVLQILSISLTDKTHLRDLFDRTKLQNRKERFKYSEPNFFNFK